MRDIRIGTASIKSILGNPEANIARVDHWARLAAAENIELLCFPELNLTGYDLSAISQTAVSVPSPITNQLETISQNHNIILLAGLAETQADGQVFASHLVITPDGIIGVYRKLHIAPPEQGLIKPGNEIPVFSTAGITFGIQLCYDAHFPELSTAMALKGAEIIFIPHASPRKTPLEKYNSWMRHLPARAFDNSLFVIACNQTGENERGLNFPGVSIAIDPSGLEIASHISGAESLLIADLKAEAFTAVRNHPMRFFLPLRRTDLY